MSMSPSGMIRLTAAIRRHRWRTAAASLAAVAVAVGVVQATPALSGSSALRLLADTDRDGQVTDADEGGRDTWDQDRGAIVLPNLDDQQNRCPTLGTDGTRLSDQELAKCNDAADNKVNGPDDADDLAPLRIPSLTDATSDTHGTVAVDDASEDKARIFVQESGDGGDRYTALAPDDQLTGEQLGNGVDLALEARDIVRDPAEWDGFIDVTLEVTDRGTTSSDRVRVRVAPLLLTHDMMPMDRMITSDNGTTPEVAERDGYDPDTPADPHLDGEAEFRRELRDGLDAAGLDDQLMEYPTDGDHWMRDQFITGYVAMPGPDGGERRKTVLLRSADVMPEESTEDFPLRDSGRPLFSVLRGPGTAAVQEFDPQRVGDDENNAVWGSFSSTGNFIVAPPYASDDGDWPNGRVLYGSDSGDAAPDAAFTRMLAAQGDQEPVPVDTSWLGVGHIDEFLSFVPADNERGWAALVADPELGESLLREVSDAGDGDQSVVRDVDPDQTEDPGLTVQEALELEKLREGNRIATEGIDAAMATLTEELDLTDADIVRVPAIFTHVEIEDYPRQEMVANYLPAVVNGVATGTGTFLAARPHAPANSGGEDVFQHATEEALAQVGGDVAWVEDWEYGHAQGTVGGELHCVTNTLRDLSGSTPWWRTDQQ